MKTKLVLLLLLAAQVALHAQYSEFVKNPFHQKYFDSLKAANYNRTFPLWGKKAYKKGFDVPYPWGIGMNYFWAKQDINITNTAIGFNDKAPVDVSNILRFGEVTSTANAYTIRPDLFVFPFLSVYGILGLGTGSTAVSVVEPIRLNTV